MADANDRNDATEDPDGSRKARQRSKPHRHTLELTPDQREWLKREADREGCTVAEFVRRRVLGVANSWAPRRPRSQTEVAAHLGRIVRLLTWVQLTLTELRREHRLTASDLLAFRMALADAIATVCQHRPAENTAEVADTSRSEAQ